MDEGAVKAIAALRADSFETEVEGIKFATPTLKPVIFEPEPDKLEMDSLRGIVDLLNNPIDEELADRSKLLIQVYSHKEVRLYGALYGKKRQRDLYALAKLSGDLQKFPFDDFIPSEMFQIKLRSLFQHTPDLEELLPFVSKLTTTDEVGTSDDGITQEVTLRRGMSGALKETGSFRPIVTLKPYRTFREIDQPESEFLLRMHAVEGKVPTVGLWEADGGAWKIDAVNKIEAYFAERLDDIKIVV